MASLPGAPSSFRLSSASRSTVLLLYLKELRSALRERSIVVNSVLLPVFLYPLLLWVMVTGVTLAEGMAEGTRSQVVVHGVPEAHVEVLDSLRAAPDLEVIVPLGAVEDAEDMLVRGDVDLVVDFGIAAAREAAMPDNFSVRLSYDRSVERSRRARARVTASVTRYRDRWLGRQARELGIAQADLEGFRVVSNSVSTERQLGTLLLSELLPLFLVIMVALGCFIPAIDTTAGERERSTWETTLTLAASRTDIVVAKYLFVTTLGLAAGVLNVVGMFAAIGPVTAPITGSGAAEFEYSLPVLAFPVMLLGTVSLSLFFAAAMMILAAFARTFKEGQGMVTPIYWLALLPLLLGQGSEATLTPVAAAIPVGNVAMMLRDAVRGVFQWPLILEALSVQVVAVVCCLLVARSVLRFEDFLIGAYDGSFWRFLKERLIVGAPRSVR